MFINLDFSKLLHFNKHAQESNGQSEFALDCIYMQYKCKLSVMPAKETKVKIERETAFSQVTVGYWHFRKLTPNA